MTWFNLNIEAFSYALLSILFEGIPFLLLGALISGLVDVFVSSERVSRLMPGSRAGGVFLGGLLGIIFPICECGSVIVVRRFVKKGLPLGCAVAYMLAAPIVSPIVALSTYTAFGLREAMDGTSPLLFTGMRLGLGYAVAIIIALIVQRLPPGRVLQPDLARADATPRRTGLSIGGNVDFASLVAGSSLGRKFVLSLQSASADFINVAFYFVIGSGMAALFVGINEHLFEPGNQPLLSIMGLMALAALLCLCSTTDAFVAANSFTAFPIEANLAFLVFGPMFDAKLFFLYGIIFKRRFVALMGVGMFLMVGFVSWRIGPVLTPLKEPAAKMEVENSADPR